MSTPTNRFVTLPVHDELIVKRITDLNGVALERKYTKDPAMGTRRVFVMMLGNCECEESRERIKNERNWNGGFFKIKLAFRSEMRKL